MKYNKEIIIEWFMNIKKLIGEEIKVGKSNKRGYKKVNNKKSEEGQSVIENEAIKKEITLKKEGDFIVNNDTKETLLNPNKIEKILELQKTIDYALVKNSDSLERLEESLNKVRSKDNLKEIEVLLKDNFEQIIDNKSLKNGLEGSINKLAREISLLKKDLIRATDDRARELKSELERPLNNLVTKEELKGTSKDLISEMKFGLNDNSKKLKGTVEDLEVLPAKITSLEKKIIELSVQLENMPSSNKKDKNLYIPEEIKVVEELSTYMEDGLKHLVNISKNYVENKKELENLSLLKDNHSKELEKVRKEEKEVGRREGIISVAREIFDKFPSDFKVIESVFEEVLTKKFEVEKIIEVNNENKNELLTYIECELENSNYRVIQAATLLGGKILSKAKVEKVIEEAKVLESQEEKVIEEDKILEPQEEKVKLTLNKEEKEVG